jgi:hypothetical protein
MDKAIKDCLRGAFPRGQLNQDRALFATSFRSPSSTENVFVVLPQDVAVLIHRR